MKFLLSVLMLTGCTSTHDVYDAADLRIERRIESDGSNFLIVRESCPRAFARHLPRLYPSEIVTDVEGAFVLDTLNGQPFCRP